ncbi:MAG: ice-binding family protein [Smithellaceae bacterium]|nr:ice-binding family protein [Smithellaceae bacterium]
MVIPATASIPVSGTQQYTAIETFSDGTSYDRTVASVWTAPDLVPVGAAGVATISNTSPTIAVATGVKLGTSTITAKYTVSGVTKTATAILTVNAVTSVSFVVTPATASIPVSGTQQYTAIETFSDGTTQDRTAASAWTSPDLSGSGVATISNSSPTIGVATGAAIGTSTITAKYTVGGITKTATAILTVNAATSASFKVTPATASITINGGSQQFVAIETFSDGTSYDRTVASAWTAVDLVPVGAAGVATISNTSPTIGVATGVNRGTSTITATYTVSGITKTATAILTVTAPNPGPAAPGPDLKTVAPYGIIAWDAITINAGSHIYGNVALPGGVMASVVGPGTKDGGVAPHLTASAVTNSAGVTPGEINTTDNGTLTPAQLTQLQTDLKSVYDDLMARAAPVTPLTTIASAAGKNGGTFPAAAPDLSGYVLSPGIFTTAGTYGLSNTSGPLVLDAGGNPDAVFIIRSTGLGISGLTSTTGSVLLQNGAQSKNIFWVMDNLTVGGGTFFQGTVVAGHVITLNTFANVQGRMLAGALSAASGAITLSGTNVITVPQ